MPSGGAAGAGAAIRRAEPGDGPAFHALWAAFVAGGPEPAAPEAAAHVWRQVMDRTGGMDMLMAASGAGGAQGFALYLVHPYSWSTRPVCYLLDLYVAPEVRGRGLGSALLDRLAAEGRARGWLKLCWLTQADNGPARALYDRIATASPLVRYDMMLNPHGREP